ncbi:MAG: haloacid dehalogenase-like hydrolase [Planctomycetes bacterium]|nr:haloacid dehalogenase-like hydrolase [Planctomycetota bacterium]
MARGIDILEEPPRGSFRHALFDFDGTISLIRDGWQNVMVPMMVEILRGTGTDETDEALIAVVKESVDYLTGKQTIYQMIRLREEVIARGGTPLEPLDYKRIYYDRLQPIVEERIADLRAGRADPDAFMLAGARPFLEALRALGLRLYLASGTDIECVRDEASVLGIAGLFDGGVYGALPNFKDFSKEKVVRGIIADHGLHGPELLSVGDGYVEIENAREVGAVALGVVSPENNRYDMNKHKRERLIRAGAHILIDDFRQGEEVIAYLFPEA